MDSGLLSLLLILILFATALNLFLVLRLARIVLPPAESEAPVPLVGQAAPSLAGLQLRHGGAIVEEELAGRPQVLVFLSPGCPTCESTIPELVTILPAAEKAGLSLWIISADDRHDVASLTGGSPLAARTVTMDAATRGALNPLGAAPLYIFIDESGIVRAGDFLGDENWRIFIGQMRDDAEAGTGGAEAATPVAVTTHRSGPNLTDSRI